ncbi:MAG: phosphoglucosamine mutase, partial [Proteobacteria bacterium]|nr:phosphoglucosamine mutase [Pseudomonadota bacterium]
VKVALPRTMRFSGLKVVVDCAHGAAYRAAPDVLFELGAEVVPLAIAPDGTNINQGCGAVHPEAMAKAVVKHKADVGLALDGDADRLIMADEKGGLIDGDQCLAVIADRMRADQTLHGMTVVGTQMSNHALHHYLAQHKVNLLRTQVGDRYIVDAMRSNNYKLGGEPSGHVLLRDYATSGDGLMTGLVMLAELMLADVPASQSLRRFTPTPQKLVNVAASDFDAISALLTSKQLTEAVKSAESELGKDGRVLIRPSGTEPLVRIMVETSDATRMQKLTETLTKTWKTLMADYDKQATQS